MRKIQQLSIVSALVLGLALTGKAQTASTPAADKKEWRLSVGPETGIPLGDFHDAYNWNFGGSVQIDIPIVQSLYVTVNAGYNDFFIKKELGGTDMKLVPVKAGLKYFPVGNIFYVQGEAGASFLTNKTDLQADKSAAFVYAPQVGVLLKLAPKNYIDLGVRFEGTSSFYNGGSNGNFLGLRAAYSFGL
jgi:hypothetical protein